MELMRLRRGWGEARLKIFVDKVRYLQKFEIKRLMACHNFIHAIQDFCKYLLSTTTGPPSNCSIWFKNEVHSLACLLLSLPLLLPDCGAGGIPIGSRVTASTPPRPQYVSLPFI
jgi:hypothetical protein